MKAHTRWTAAVFIASAAMTGLVIAQGAATPAPAPQGQAPAPTAPAAPAGRGAGRANVPAGGGQRRGGFTQFTRPVASQDVIVRGKSLYEANCASCHAVDLRGRTTAPLGPNLLRAGTTLSDQRGELVTAAVAKHQPKLTLVESDTVAIAEYIHSILATTGGQGSPPGRNPTGITLNVLVGDPQAGQAAFGTLCSSCHSVTGDLKGIGAKYAEPRDLQNAWVSGSGGAFGGGGGGGRGGGAGGREATVTLADGTKLQGTLVRADDFLIIMNLPDGTRKSMARTPAMKLDVKDPQEAHKAMALKLDDPENKKMHDITAYLATIK